MTPAWAWPLTVLGCLGWILFAVAATGHVIRHLRKPPGHATPRPGIQPPAEFPRPRSVPTFEERQRLDAIARARVTAPPASANATEVIADGLRLRFPALDDTTLGLVTLELFGYAHAFAVGFGNSPAFALQCTVDSLGLTAEELTRLARNEVPR